MIDLAHCADFNLGQIRVRPSSRELVGADGPVMVEPKVMQVLVTLADAGGRVVSRDELIEKCWSGRVVGEDAINRIISKLRRVAQASGGAFRVETVARSGHRLLQDAVAVVESATEPTPVRAQHRAWWLVPASAASLLIVIMVVAGRREPTPVGHFAGPAAMPAAVTDLETRGLSSMFENTPEQTAEGVGYLRQATALAPRAAPVWGSLAMSYVLSLGWAAPGERVGIAARVRDAANRGLGLDPRESRSAAALVSLEPTFGRWTAKAAALAAAKARSRPDNGPLAFQEAQFLMATGRNRAALAAIRPVIATSPLVPWVRAAHIELLAAAGRLVDADREADDAAKIWPRDRLIWFTRFDLATFNGQPERALAMAADRGGWPKQTSAAEIELAARTARAMASRSAADASALLATLAETARNGQADAERAIRAAVALGQPGAALSLARRLYGARLMATPRATVLPNIGQPSDADPPTAALFLPPAGPLWTDPAIFDLMEEIGLAAYWRRAGPPDICKVPDMRSRCRVAGIIG
ncbi:winged helix-turn-helix domain-containing protein [Sphingosinicellaceae bacterium]|nr:winged helix-turn-helix domain-containing protein [Sphingosinicellaceae bacterium]